jgi:hypothetical protein
MEPNVSVFESLTVEAELEYFDEYQLILRQLDKCSNVPVKNATIRVRRLLVTRRDCG